MSLQVLLMNNTSEPIKVDKDVTTIVVITGVLRDESDLLNPVITFTGLSDNQLKANYAYITSFNRYYYITDIKYIRNGVYEFYFHVDVLKTYSDAIKNQKAVVARQENQWNLYLNDDNFKVYQKPEFLSGPNAGKSSIYTLSFPNSFNTFNYVLTVAGGGRGN